MLHCLTGGAADAEPAEEDAERLKDLESEATVDPARKTKLICGGAVENPCTRIPSEPSPTGCGVRYRYGGVMHEVEPPAGAAASRSHLAHKIMSRLDIAERRLLPQDGRIKADGGADTRSIRVSSYPRCMGEGVLRVLDRSASRVRNLRSRAAAIFRARARAGARVPNGMVLVTGPPGPAAAHKTTTLLYRPVKLKTGGGAMS